MLVAPKLLSMISSMSVSSCLGVRRRENRVGKTDYQSNGTVIDTT